MYISYIAHYPSQVQLLQQTLTLLIFYYCIIIECLFLSFLTTDHLLNQDSSHNTIIFSRASKMFYNS